MFKREQESFFLSDFPFFFGVEVVFFAVGALPVFLLTETGEGESLVKIRERLPLSGVGAERSREVFVLSVCAMWVCTGVCASVRVAAARVESFARVGGEGAFAVAIAGTSVAEGRAKRTSALDRSTDTEDPEGVV